MPSRAPSICSHCNQAHTEPCAAAKRMAAARKATHDAKRPSRQARGYDNEWTREAKAFLALPENRLCQCGAPAVLVAHRRSIRQRPDLRMVRSNWRPSCQRCNANDAARERQTERN